MMRCGEDRQAQDLGEPEASGPVALSCLHEAEEMLYRRCVGLNLGCLGSSGGE